MHETVGLWKKPDRCGLAWRRVQGLDPTILWLGGFKSDMAGTKASMLAAWAGHAGRDFLRFDYSGHGESEGAFEDGTIGAWRDDALAVIDELTDGRLVLVGSSMGGWIACLAAMARPERIKALVLIAPAADFTDQLMWPQFPPRGPRRDRDQGQVDAALALRPGRLSDHAWPDRGRPALEHPRRAGRDRLSGAHFAGGRDADVPWRHALALHELLASEDKVFTLINDADHSLSRPQDLTRIAKAIEEVG